MENIAEFSLLLLLVIFFSLPFLLDLFAGRHTDNGIGMEDENELTQEVPAEWVEEPRQDSPWSA